MFFILHAFLNVLNSIIKNDMGVQIIAGISDNAAGTPEEPPELVNRMVAINKNRNVKNE